MSVLQLLLELVLCGAVLYTYLSYVHISLLGVALTLAVCLYHIAIIVVIVQVDQIIIKSNNCIHC